MKKGLVTILAFFYLGVSMGATLHLHYCMGKLVNWGLAKSEAKSCSKCGMEKKHAGDNGCCKDKQQQVKLEQDQKLASFITPDFTLGSIDLPTPLYRLHVSRVISRESGLPFSNAPPECYTVPAYIRHCFFLI